MERAKYNLPLVSLLMLASSEAAFSEAMPTTVKRFSRSEIAAAANPQFIQTRDLSNILSEKLSLLATTLTARQGGSNKALYTLAGESAELTRDAHLKRLAILHYEDRPTAEVNADKLRILLAGQTRKSGEVKFKEALPIIDTIQRGLSFKWSLTGVKPAPSAAEIPQIRYGLVVSEILPQEAPGIASSGTISDSYWQYARQARVVYTIDRLEEDTSKSKVFRPVADDHGPAPAAVKSRHIFLKPSTDVSLKVEAANSEDTVSDKVGGGSLPGAKVSLTQADGLVSTQIITNSRLGKESMSFETMLPLIGEASITRKWNNSFMPTQTSANNLLVKPSAPKLNLHHLILEDRFKGELLVKANTIDFGLAIEPRKGWAPEDQLGRSGDKISMTFINTF